MNNPQHTPGPWFVGTYPNSGGYVGRVFSESPARLIAEAPAMLEALRFAVQYMGPPRNGGQREALEAFRAILARIDAGAGQ